MWKGVVYEVPCEDCEQGYVGETSRTLKKRIVEHNATVRKENKKNEIAVHVKNTKHYTDWEGTKVISNERQYRVVEAISIQTQTPDNESGLWSQAEWHLALSP